MHVSRTIQLASIGMVTLAVLIFRWQAYTEIIRGDAIYEGVVAQEMLRGNGFATRLMPLGAFHGENSQNQINGERWLSEHKFVGSQVRIALSALILNQTITSDLLRKASFWPTVVLIVVVIFICHQAFSPLVAITISWFAIFSLPLQLVGTLGVGISADALLFLSCCVLGYRIYINQSKCLSFLLGLAVGIAITHRYSMLIWAPFWLMVVLYSTYKSGNPRRNVIENCSLFLLSSSLTTVPLFAYSVTVFHKLFPSYLSESLWLHGTVCLPLDPWYTSKWPSIRECLDSNPQLFFTKFFSNLQQITSNCDLEIMLISPMLLVSLISIMEKHFFIIVAIIFGLIWLVLSLLLSPDPIYHLYLLPIAWLLAGVGLSHLFERLKGKQLATYFLQLACILAIVATTKDFIDEVRYNTTKTVSTYPDRMTIASEVIEHLNDLWLEPQDIIMGGDRPWELALNTDFRIVPLPAHLDELVELQAKGLRPLHILIPNDVGFFGVSSSSNLGSDWRRVLSGEPFKIEGYQLSHVFSDKSLLLSRE